MLLRDSSSRPRLPTNVHPLATVDGKRSTAANSAEIQGALGAGLRFELGIDSFFGASHAIRPSGERHTHSFRVQASFVSDRLDDNGMIWGLREAADLLEHEARRYANRFLNEIEPFNAIQPTGENLAALICRNLIVATLESMAGGPRLVHVTLWENPASYVRVSLMEAVT